MIPMTSHLRASIRQAVAHSVGMAAAVRACDSFSDIARRRLPADAVASTFFGDLCDALAQGPGHADDRSLLARLRQIGLVPGSALDWATLDPAVRRGLAAGLEDAADSMFADTALPRPPRL